MTHQAATNITLCTRYFEVKKLEVNRNIYPNGDKMDAIQCLTHGEITPSTCGECIFTAATDTFYWFYS